MYKVLVFGMTENPGGVESFLMNNYRNINSHKIHFDFLCNTINKIAFEDEILKNNSRIFNIYPRRKDPFRFRKELNDFFRKHANEYNCAWINLNTLVNIDYLKVAKKYGIKRIIVHSHNSRNMDTGFKGYITQKLHNLHKKQLQKYATDYWACSSFAAKWFYTNDLLKKVKIIKNAIDVNNFSFNEKKRQSLRQKLHLENNLVIGNVGRLHFQKNQMFILDVLSYLVKLNPKVRLVLVGQGADKEKLENRVNELNLQKYVIFAGVQDDIQEWLSTFDLFIFPSLFEGLGIAGLEAEANGLPIYASDKVIPQELKINSNFKFLDLGKGPQFWAHQIEKSNFERENQETIEKNFQNSGYSIESSVQKLEKYFLKEEK